MKGLMKVLSIKEWLIIIVSVSMVCYLIWNVVTLDQIKKDLRYEVYELEREVSHIENMAYDNESDLYSIKRDLAFIEARLYRVEYILKY